MKVFLLTLSILTTPIVLSSGKKEIEFLLLYLSEGDPLSLLATLLMQDEFLERMTNTTFVPLFIYPGAHPRF